MQMNLTHIARKQCFHRHTFEQRKSLPVIFSFSKYLPVNIHNSLLGTEISDYEILLYAIMYVEIIRAADCMKFKY